MKQQIQNSEEGTSPSYTLGQGGSDPVTQNPSSDDYMGRNTTPLSSLPAGGQASQGNQQNIENEQQMIQQVKTRLQQQEIKNQRSYQDLNNPMSFGGDVNSKDDEIPQSMQENNSNHLVGNPNGIEQNQNFSNDKNGVKQSSQVQNSASRANNSNQTNFKNISAVSGSNQGKVNYDAGFAGQIQHNSQRREDFQYDSVESRKDNTPYVTADNPIIQHEQFAAFSQQQVRTNDFQTCETALIGTNDSSKQYVNGQDQEQRSPLEPVPYPHLQDAEALRQLQSQSALKTASSQILKTAKSLYSFIVPVAQLNLNQQHSMDQSPNPHHQEMLASGQNANISPMNANDLQFHMQRQNKSQAQGAGPRRFGRDARYASNACDPLIASCAHKRDLSNSNSHYAAAAQGAVVYSQNQFAQIDSITNFEGAPSTMSSRQLTYQQYQQQQQNMGQLNFISYEGQTGSNFGQGRLPKNLTQRNMDYQNGFPLHQQNAQTFRGQNAQEEIHQGRLRQLNDNKEASNTVIHNINQMQQKLQTQFDSSKQFLKNFEILLDHYQLKITVHSVQIDIPQSIKMTVQGSYTPNVQSQKDSITKPQSKQTEKRCRVDLINAKKANGKDQQCLKIADFKNQELIIDIYAESDIQYTEAHLTQFARANQESKSSSQKQKCAIKLLAISEDKQKLIGVYNHQFYSKLKSTSGDSEKQFEPLNRQAAKFQKSIDKNASVCISTELQPIKTYSQQDYESMFAAFSKRKIDVDFSQADDMGDETLLSGDNASEKLDSHKDGHEDQRRPPEDMLVDSQAAKSKVSTENPNSTQRSVKDISIVKVVRGDQEAKKPQTSSTKKGINNINTSTLPGMRLRGPLASASSQAQSNQASGQKPKAFSVTDQIKNEHNSSSAEVAQAEVKEQIKTNQTCSIERNDLISKTEEIDIHANAEPAETIATILQDNEIGLVEEDRDQQPAAKSTSKKAQPATSNLEALEKQEELRPKSQSVLQPELLNAQQDPQYTAQNQNLKQSVQIQKAVTPAIRPGQHTDQRFQYNYVQPEIRPEIGSNNEQYQYDEDQNNQYNRGGALSTLDGQSSISKTMNILYEKFQAGVTTVKKAIDENQAAANAAHLKRSHSSNQPMQRYPGFEGNNKHLDQTQLQIQLQQDEGDHLRVRNLIQQMHSPRGIPGESTGGRGRPPIPSQSYHGNHPSSRGVSTGRPPANAYLLEQRKEQINEKTLLNEIETFKQEKKFLQNRLEAQQKQYDEQTKLLNEKIQHQEKKYNKRKSSVNEMKLRLEQQLKNYIEIQQRNENEFKDEYEYMLHLYTHNNQLKDMFEQKFHTATQEKEDVEAKLHGEIEQLKQSLEQADVSAKRADDEKSDAYEQKISIQQEEIEALLNEKQKNEGTIKDKDQVTKINDEKLSEYQKQIAQLEQQLKQQEKHQSSEMKHINEESALRESELSQLKQKYKEQESKIAATQNDHDQARAHFEAQINELKQTNSELESTLTAKQESLLQNDKHVFKLENDLEQFQKMQNQQKQEAGKSQAALDDLREQNEDLIERLRFTESQLIQVKSSWAEAEHEREQFFNQIQEQEERTCALTEQIETQKQTIASLLDQSKKSATTAADGQQSTREEDGN